MIKIVKAPVRIDFAGGTTDIYPFTKRGGAVLNAAINKYVVGKLITTDKKVSLEYHADIPTSSGLGTSGVMDVVWLALTSSLKERKILAETVYSIEQATGIVGGKQDEYAASFGGINFLEFKGRKTKITQLSLSKKIIQELENHLLLCYTKKPHLATRVNKKVIDNVLKGKAQTISSLKKITKIAYQMRDSLYEKDLLTFATLMNEEWENRKKLHKEITTPLLETTIQKGLTHGALGAKVCGAAGGGSILFYCSNRNEVIKAIKKNTLPITFKFDFKGIKILKHKT